MPKTHKTRNALILTGLLASILPVWRDPSYDGPANLWIHVWSMATKDREHIPYDQAVTEAQEAYNEVHGIGFPWMVVGVAAQVPVWKSGGKKNLTFWDFARNHTIWGEPIEYIPKESYTKILKEERNNEI